jgi:FKBP-type peptidyl-prolyl cis-trans isomerase FklB
MPHLFQAEAPHMNFSSFPTALAALLATTVLASAAPAAETPAAPAAMDEAARMQYALGYQLGRDLVAIEPRPQDLLRGVEDARTGAKSRLSDEEMNAALASLETKINEQRAKTQAAAAAEAKTKGTAYLAENAKKPGVVTTPSGLQYRVVTPGTGKTPTAADSVTVHYRGTLIDGTEFDSSYKRGEPATFPVAGVIAGWTEALQLMKVGAKYQLTIPPELAYGDRGQLAGQVLLFDVELLGATPPAQAPK